MLKLVYDEKIHLDKWDIDVKPYLTLKEMSQVINVVIKENNYLDKKSSLIASVLILCTDLIKDGETLSYEEVLYSGLWEDILLTCPVLAQNVKDIQHTVDECLSLENRVAVLLEVLTDKISDIDFSKLDISELTQLANQLGLLSQEEQ